MHAWLTTVNVTIQLTDPVTFANAFMDIGETPTSMMVVKVLYIFLLSCYDPFQANIS
jgi:hypothetical protein